jgi:hypothetical protein
MYSRNTLNIILITLTICFTIVHAGHGDTSADSKYCRRSDGSHDMSKATDGHDHSGHHHRMLDGHSTYKEAQGICKTWVSLISNYTAENGKDGSHVWVFSDGSTTSQIDAKIFRDGTKLMKTKVMGHLHVGTCDAPGAHWKSETTHDEVHFMFNTTMDGDAVAKTCNNYKVSQSAKSIVLHESDANAIVGMNAKKLCCNLIWSSDIAKGASSTIVSMQSSTSTIVSFIMFVLHYLF